MALMNPEKSMIRRKNLLPFHRLDFIRMIYNKSHTQAENLPSCHEGENNCVFPRKCTIPENICHLTPILQGGIAFFAVFSIKCRLCQEIARNGKKYVALPDSGKDLGLSEKSLISRNNLLLFHEMIHNRMLSEKSHDLNFNSMSINYVGFIFLLSIKIALFRIISCRCVRFC